MKYQIISFSTKQPVNSKIYKTFKSAWKAWNKYGSTCHIVEIK